MMISYVSQKVLIPSYAVGKCCPISVYALTTSKIEAIIEIHRWGLYTLQMVEGKGEGEGRACVLSRWIEGGCE
jgi:hypothetical protein